LSEACVATGMNMGNDTGPCGRIRFDARALVVFEVTKSALVCSAISIEMRDVFLKTKGLLTEHFAMISNLRAADCADVDIAAVKDR